MLIFILLGAVLIIALASISQIHSEIQISGREDRSPDLPPFGRVDFSDLPENYSFVLVWNSQKTGFYDSEDGILITEDQNTGTGYLAGVLYLDESSKSIIRNILSKLNLASCYGYCPPEIASGETEESLMLTVRCGREERTVICSGETQFIDEKVTAERLHEYVDACRSILSVINESQNGQSLPAGNMLAG